MELISLHRETADEDGNIFTVTYLLTYSPRRKRFPFGLRCFIEGSFLEHSYNFFEKKSLFNTFQAAEAALETLAEKDVFPVHIEEVLCENPKVFSLI